MSKGSISGLKAKCQVTLDQLDWDLEEGSVVCKLTSDVDQTINFILRDGISSIESDADIENSDLGDIARKINLKANTATELKIRLAEDGERNLALKKTAVASSQSMTSRQQLRLWTEIWEHAGEPARRQTTGFMWTWGESYDITNVKLHWEDSYARKYKIQVSEDAEHWTDVFTNDNNEGGLNVIPLKATGRYVKMQGVEKSGEWGFSIWEFEVYGTLTPPPANLALNKPATAKNSSNDQQTPEKAFDGSTGSRWSGHQDDDNWIAVDLEDTYIIESVVLNWEDSMQRSTRYRYLTMGRTGRISMRHTTAREELRPFG